MVTSLSLSHSQQGVRHVPDVTAARPFEDYLVPLAREDGGDYLKRGTVRGRDWIWSTSHGDTENCCLATASTDF